MSKYKMKTIGIFTHDFYPSKWWQWTHLFNIYKSIRDNGFDDFIIFSPAHNSVDKHMTIFPSTDYSMLKNIGMSIMLFFRIRRIIADNHLWLIHLHWWPWGLFLMRKQKIPVVYTCHHTYWQQFNYVRWQKWKVVFYYLEKLSYALADRIICVSQDTKAILHERYGIGEDKLTYIPNWINLEEFKRDDTIKKETNSLVFLWRLDERKWIDFLVRTMALITRWHEEIRLYIIWDWKLKEELVGFSKANKLEKNIFFCWRLWLEDLKMRIQESEIMITPSVFEWFWISVLEWMALRTPVIWSNVDWIRTIIQSWDNWILVKYWDEEELRDAVYELLNNRDLQEKYIENAYADLEKKYNWNLIAKQHIHEYAKLLNQSKLD